MGIEIRQATEKNTLIGVCSVGTNPGHDGAGPRRIAHRKREVRDRGQIGNSSTGDVCRAQRIQDDRLWQYVDQRGVKGRTAGGIQLRDETTRYRRERVRIAQGIDIEVILPGTCRQRKVGATVPVTIALSALSTAMALPDAPPEPPR